MKKYLLLLGIALLACGAGCSSPVSPKTTPASTQESNVTTSTGQTMSAREVRDLLMSKLGMIAVQDPLFSKDKATSPDGSLTAEAYERHNDRVIRVLNAKTNVEDQYVNLDDFATIDEIGDLHFSPDGTKLAYALYAFNSAQNDEVSLGGMSYVYVIDLKSGKQDMLSSNKEAGSVLRVTGWKGESPIIEKQAIEKSQQPGKIPKIYIPYTLETVNMP